MIAVLGLSTHVDITGHPLLTSTGGNGEGIFIGWAHHETVSLLIVSYVNCRKYHILSDAVE